MRRKVMIIGNVGRDPELNVTSDGTPVTKFSLAVNRNYKSRTGDRKEETEWFNIVAGRQLEETCERYLHKGSRVYIEGRMTQRKYTDREGVQRTSVEVIANDMQMLDTKAASSGSESYAAGSTGDRSDPFLPDYPDDLP